MGGEDKMWIIVKFSLVSGQMRYFGPFDSKKEAEKWGNKRWIRDQESWWGVTKLEDDAID